MKPTSERKLLGQMLRKRDERPSAKSRVTRMGVTWLTTAVAIFFMLRIVDAPTTQGLAWIAVAFVGGAIVGVLLILDAAREQWPVVIAPYIDFDAVKARFDSLK